MIKLTINNKDIPFEITKFPDGTSQVWKIAEFAAQKRGDSPATVTWKFENESELVHVLQLAKLLEVVYNVDATLFVPFLPYGRQDHEISNETTWARRVILPLLSEAFSGGIITYDGHSEDALVKSLSPLIHSLVNKYDAICYPDTGAMKKYSFNSDAIAYGYKTRDAVTGLITHYDFSGTIVNKKNVLIIDDICDGGITFIKLTALLKQQGAKNIDLYVSHGIFSKGIDVLYEAGINKIFTTNSINQKHAETERFQVYDIISQRQPL